MLEGNKDGQLGKIFRDADYALVEKLRMGVDNAG
jgi:hypothetical protein